MDASTPTRTLKRLNILAGHYGSGKTNIAVNLALLCRREYPDCGVHIADLDIVNPYFRTADAEDLLSRHGIDVQVPQFANSNVDIPSMPPRLVAMFDSRTDFSIIDVGGDDGAIALGMYHQPIMAAGYDLYYVINRYRPLIADPRDAYECMLQIEEASRLKCTKIINNSSLGSETTAEDILASVEYARECAALCSLPLVAHTYCPAYAPNTPDVFAAAGLSGEPLFPILDTTKKLF